MMTMTMKMKRRRGRSALVLNACWTCRRATMSGGMRSRKRGIGATSTMTERETIVMRILGAGR
jgi:hypothetical protein